MCFSCCVCAEVEAVLCCPFWLIGRGFETACSEALELEPCGLTGCDVQTVWADTVAAAAEVEDIEATDFGSGWVCERNAARKLLRNGLWVGILASDRRSSRQVRGLLKPHDRLSGRCWRTRKRFGTERYRISCSWALAIRLCLSRAVLFARVVHCVHLD